MLYIFYRAHKGSRTNFYIPVGSPMITLVPSVCNKTKISRQRQVLIPNETTINFAVVKASPLIGTEDYAHKVYHCKSKKRFKGTKCGDRHTA